MLKELQVRIGATTVEFQKKMAEVQATVAKVGTSFQKFSQQATQSFSNVTKSLEKNADSIRDFGEMTSTFLTLPLGIAAGASIKLASDFQESLNKVNVAFGNSASSVIEWSKTSIDSMGMASGSALDASALFGDMATSMGIGQAEASNMSMSLVQLGADMASFKNVPIEQAMQALNGVFTGETESLKMLGVVMTQTQLEAFALSQGIQKNIKDMSEAEMINLRYAFVMSKTKNAQGDFARTAGGSANQMRIFWESLKEVGRQIADTILPAFTSFLTWINKLLKGFTELSDGAKFLIAILGGLAIAIPPIIVAVGMLGQALPFITGGFDKMSKSMKGALGWIGLIVTAIGTVSAYFLSSEENMNKLTYAFEKLKLMNELILESVSYAFGRLKNVLLKDIATIELSFLNFVKNTSYFDFMTFGYGVEYADKRVAELQKTIDSIDTENANKNLAYTKDIADFTAKGVRLLNQEFADLMGRNSFDTKQFADLAGQKGREAIEKQQQKTAVSIESVNKKLDEQKTKLDEVKKRNLDFAKTLNEAVITALKNKNDSIIESVKVLQKSIDSEKDALKDLKKQYMDSYEKIRDEIDETYKLQIDTSKDKYEDEIDKEKDLTEKKIDEIEVRRKNLENQISLEIGNYKEQAYQQKKLSILNEMFNYKNLKTRKEVVEAISKLTLDREKELNATGNSIKLDSIEQFTDEENKLIVDRLSEYRKLEYSNLTDTIEALKAESNATLQNKKLKYEEELAQLKEANRKQHEENTLNMVNNLAMAQEESNKKIAYFQAEIKIKEKGLVDLSSKEKEQLEAKRLLLDEDHKNTKELLRSYNSDYFIAGRDFAQELINGLNSKKSDITKLMESIASPLKKSEPVKSGLEIGKEFANSVTNTIRDSVGSAIEMANAKLPVNFNYPKLASNNAKVGINESYPMIANPPMNEYNRTNWMDIATSTRSTTPAVYLDGKEISKAIMPYSVDIIRSKTGLLY